jgi:hypothetical protein
MPQPPLQMRQNDVSTRAGPFMVEVSLLQIGRDVVETMDYRETVLASRPEFHAQSRTVKRSCMCGQETAGLGGGALLESAQLADPLQWREHDVSHLF